MTRKLFGTLLLALFCLCGPAFAETVYIPVPADVRAGNSFEARVEITNTGLETASFTTYFIPAGSNGLDRADGAEQGYLLLPGATLVTGVEGVGLGLFEITSDHDGLAVHARLVGNRDGAEYPGTDLPVLTRSNAFAANTTADVQGWARNGSLVTDFGAVNLGFQEATCRVDVRRVDGSAIATNISLTWSPRSQRQFDDALGILNLSGVSAIRAAIRCDQSFYPYATQFENATGEMLFIAPSAKVEDGVSDPGAADFVYLDDLDWSGTYNVRNGPHKNVSGFEPHAPGGAIGGYKPIQINGVTYPRGVSWFPGWGDSKVTWQLGGQYKRFQAIVRVDDEKFGEYEWGVVNRSTGQFIRIERPPQGFNGPESNTRFRIGAGCHLKINADGATIYESPEFYAYGPSVDVDIDVEGVQQLDIILIGTHSEQAGAPHRAGLTSTPALVQTNTFHDLIDLADAKLLLD
jgi:NPCBM/NEW2 domain